MDLPSTTVLFDFDGTVSTGDVGVYLLENLADPSWQAIERRFLEGEIGSRECLEQQFALLPNDEELLRKTAREVPLDPAFGLLVDILRDAGAEVGVVSDGFGFHVRDAMRDFNVPVITNDVDFATGKMLFPNYDAAVCSRCATCKEAPVRDAKNQGRTVVFVGDGASDRDAAVLADQVFATAHLAEWCERVSIPYNYFVGLADVYHALVGTRGVAAVNG